MCGGGTVWQDHYRATVAVPLSEIAGQNGGVLGDCVWRTADVGDEYGWRSYSSSAYPAVTVGDVPAGVFVAIPMETEGGGGDERSGTMPRSRTVDGVGEATQRVEG
jgi:hypothetical protein